MNSLLEKLSSNSHFLGLVIENNNLENKRRPKRNEKLNKNDLINENKQKKKKKKTWTNSTCTQFFEAKIASTTFSIHTYKYTTLKKKRHSHTLKWKIKKINENNKKKKKSLKIGS